MKTTLAMIVRNEEQYLSLILPKLVRCFSEVVAVDAESTDRTRAILDSYSAKIMVRPWTDDYSAARNEAVALASGEAVFMLDADEAMFPEDIEKVKRVLEKDPVVVLPRIEFVFDHRHYNPGIWPDWQCRFFRTDSGFRFEGRVHEQLVLSNGSGFASERAIQCKDAPIYHYGQAKPVEVTWLRHYNYGRIRQRLPTLDRPPAGAEIVLHHNVALFEGDHPLKGVP